MMTSLRLKPIWILLLAMVLLSSCQNRHGEKIEVTIQRVVSGQTLEVVIDSQTPEVLEKVRLIGISAPDWRQKPWGLQAKERLEELLSNSLSESSIHLEIDNQTQDSYGRYLAYVWRDGILINEKLVQEGYVLAAPLPPNDKYNQRFAYAQEYARLMGLGIWNPEQPMGMTPQEFRNQN